LLIKNGRAIDPLIISSRRNPLVKRLRLISKKSGRDEYGMLLLEGTHLLQEALTTKYIPKEIVATSSWLQKYPDILLSIQSKVQIHEVTKPVLEAALTTVNPDGVASLFPISGLPTLPETPSFVLALDRVQDPGNIGSLFRTALAAGIDTIWLASGADPLNQKVIRASVGAVLKMPYERFGSNEKQSIELIEKKINQFRQKGFQIIATSSIGRKSDYPLRPYWEMDWSKPTVLVLGNEGSGLHPDIENCCTAFATLPHSDSVESLNVAAAAVPILLERRRSKMIMGIHNQL